MTYKRRNTQKHEKVQNKMVFFAPTPPVFLPKRPKKGPFFLSVRFCEDAKGQLSLDGE